MNEALQARYFYQRRIFRRKIKSFESRLEEKDKWNTILIQAVQLNDSTVRSQRAQIENLHERIESKYKLGKRLAKIEFEKHEDAYLKQIISLRKEVRKLANVKASLGETIKSLELSHKKSIEKIEEEKKLVEVFNNQLCEQYKGQEGEISFLNSEVKILNEKNQNLRKENSDKEIRLNKLIQQMTSLSERTKKSETKMKEIDDKIENLKTKDPKTKQDSLPPPSKRKRKKKD